MKAKFLLSNLLLFCVLMINAQVKWTVYNTSNSLISSNSIFAVVIDSLNNKWVGTSTTKNLDKFNGSDWVNYYNNQISGNQGGNLVIDKKGYKWLAGDGLVSFTGAKWTNYNTSNSGLPDNAIYDIAVDRKNNKWIGTRTAGFSKI